MWDRKELKAKGKAAYNANQIACIIAALILMIAGGIGSGTTSSATAVPSVIFSSAVIALISIAALVGVMVCALILNPLNVGARKFFIQNSSDPQTSVGGGNIGFGFGKNYRDIVFAMFGTQVLNLLWILLLIVPGIYKAYCWRMVPYIIAEDPGISGSKARKMSADMMNGSKWASFVLDLSFIGWRLVGAITFGILNIVFTNPYQAAAETELYLTLKDKKS